MSWQLGALNAGLWLLVKPRIARMPGPAAAARALERHAWLVMHQPAHLLLLARSDGMHWLSVGLVSSLLAEPRAAVWLCCSVTESLEEAGARMAECLRVKHTSCAAARAFQEVLAVTSR